MHRIEEEMQKLRELFVNFTTRGRSVSAFSFLVHTFFLGPYLPNLWAGNGREGSMPSSFTKRYTRLPKVQVEQPWFSVTTERPVVPSRSRWAKTKFLFPKGDHPAAGANKVQVVQPYWSKKLKDFHNDSHQSAAFGDHKPSMVGYLANKPQSVFHIVLVGEVKARRQVNKESFNTSKMGHWSPSSRSYCLSSSPTGNL
jgi:hypothetical protein